MFKGSRIKEVGTGRQLFSLRREIGGVRAVRVVPIEWRLFELAWHQSISAFGLLNTVVRRSVT